MKEFNAGELIGRLDDQYDEHETQYREVVIKINTWLRRGDGVAVYLNASLGHREAGARMFVSYGSPQAQLEVSQPPLRMPDIGGQVNWRYQLEGTYRGAPLTEPDEPRIPGTEITYTTHSYQVAMDNHEPARAVRSGILRRYVRRTGRPGIEIPYAATLFQDAAKAIYLVDDGKTVVAHYVSGWGGNREDEPIQLDTFPVNPDGEKRPDDGREIDYSDWMLGPRRAYHLKVLD